MKSVRKLKALVRYVKFFRIKESRPMNSPPFNFCVREALVCFSLINRFRKTQRPRVGKFIYYFSVSAFLKLAKSWLVEAFEREVAQDTIVRIT